VLGATSDGTVMVTSYLVKTASEKKTLITRYR
jgi:hypothetical protein